MSFHNIQALQNTELLLAYSDLHPVVAQLVLTVKIWAKSEHVLGAMLGHLSSYSFSLLVVYFLQVQLDLAFPCLDTNAFDSGCIAGEQNVDKWSCQASLEVLVERFFNFYGGHGRDSFQWGFEVVSVRVGERRSPEETCFHHLPGKRTARLHIEDPFLRYRNLNCVLRFENESILKASFQRTSSELAVGKVPLAFSADMISRQHVQGGPFPDSSDSLASHLLKQLLVTKEDTVVSSEQTTFSTYSIKKPISCLSTVPVHASSPAHMSQLLPSLLNMSAWKRSYSSHNVNFETLLWRQGVFPNAPQYLDFKASQQPFHEEIYSLKSNSVHTSDASDSVVRLKKGRNKIQPARFSN